MAASDITLSPGALWPLLRERTREALACGALRPVETRFQTIEEGGICFLVRIASSLQRKARERNPQEQGPGPEINPFLPPEPELTVADISPTHIGVLNKFNVIDHHLLIVTRGFEDQEVLLTREDFQALWACMAEIDGLAFYNGGAAAGASQRHKHLQLVPLPLSRALPQLPIESLLPASPRGPGIQTVAALPFSHAFAWLPENPAMAPGKAADFSRRLYADMLAAVGIGARTRGVQIAQSAPYNLLLTRRWMLLVPRSRELFAGISVNALGFAGSLFVKNEHEKARLLEIGPLCLLREVGVAGPG